MGYCGNSEKVTEMARLLFKEERSRKRLDGWFRILEIELSCGKLHENREIDKALRFRKTVKELPLDVSDYSVFVGTQRDAFARSYSLINPSFTVAGFSGYCDPTAVFGDIEPNEEFPKERIEHVRSLLGKTDYISELSNVYKEYENETKEVIFFFEQVTGHLIPDFRYAIAQGLLSIIDELNGKKGNGYRAMKLSLENVIILADRYKDILVNKRASATDERRKQLDEMIMVLTRVPRYGAENLQEAIQMFILLWQCMCMEQAPNPFAFSVGNADRIFAPYIKGISREDAAALFKHFLVFFNVGDRSWAISQNIIVGGRDKDGNDLSNDATYALLDAYFDMNLPQPILSVKFHKNTPEIFYRELGRFFFSPGVLTPSMFNEDALRKTLEKHGIESEDLDDISIAGCQEPLIMGRDTGNTTNTWLNMAKVLEVTLTGGISNISGERLCNVKRAEFKNIREEFYQNIQYFCNRMASAGNGASKALSNLRVPVLSCFMGGLENGIDARDTERQCTKYNGSGCLIHGLSVVADSFIAIDKLLKERPEDADRLLDALKNNFIGYEDLHEFLKSADKFGNNIEEVDREAADIAYKVAEIVRNEKNYLGNSFRPDYSSPTTHLLYGYWVGATPDGRASREMLGYGVDPLFGEATNGLGFRMLSNMGLPFGCMNGGYASHLGIDPKYFTKESLEDKGVEFKNKIVKPLFFNEDNESEVAPFYLYVNVTTAEILRKVLANPEKYAPSGVYIMRIHGTFVNFLDLSPEIQQDIIKRLDPKSTAVSCPSF